MIYEFLTSLTIFIPIFILFLLVRLFVPSILKSINNLSNQKFSKMRFFGRLKLILIGVTAIFFTLELSEYFLGHVFKEENVILIFLLTFVYFNLIPSYQFLSQKIFLITTILLSIIHLITYGGSNSFSYLFFILSSILLGTIVSYNKTSLHKILLSYQGQNK